MKLINLKPVHLDYWRVDKQVSIALMVMDEFSLAEIRTAEGVKQDQTARLCRLILPTLSSKKNHCRV